MNTSPINSLRGSELSLIGKESTGNATSSCLYVELIDFIFVLPINTRLRCFDDDVDSNNTRSTVPLSRVLLIRYLDDEIIVTI